MNIIIIAIGLHSSRPKYKSMFQHTQKSIER